MNHSSLSTHFSEASGLAYHEFGDPHSRRVVVFHHGWPSAGSQGVIFAEAASKHRVRLISPSRPGIAGSRMQAGRGFCDWPARLGLLLDDLGIGEPVFIMGVSGGGPYALAACAGMSQRIQRGGVIGGAGRVSGSMQDMVWLYRAMAGLDKYAPWSLGLVMRVFRMLMHLPGAGAGPGTRAAGLPPRDRAALEDPQLREFISRGFVEAMQGDVQGVVEDGRLYLREWCFDPATIGVPVTFWHGRRDRNIPPRIPEALAGTIADADLRWFEDDGHYSLPLLHAEQLLLELLEAASSST